MDRTVYIKISKPLPSTTDLPSLDVNPLVTNVEVETGPGGFSVLRVGLTPPHQMVGGVHPSLEQPAELEYGAHVVAYVGGHIIFEGYVERIDASFTGFECVGYFAAGNWSSLDAAHDGTAKTHTIAAEAIRTCPWWVLGEVPSPTSPSYREWSSVQYMTSTQIIDTLSKEGADGVEWLFTVYEDRVARIVPKVAPAKPTYRLAYDPSTMEIAFDYANVVDAVRATYEDADGIRRVTKYVYRSGVDTTSAYLKKLTLSTSGRGDVVMQFLNTWMHTNSTPQLSGTITINTGDGLTLPTGIVVPSYMARYGQTVEIDGYGTAFIESTSCSISDDTATISIGTPPPTSFAGLLSQAQNAAIALQSKRDPVTGNRL